MAVLQCNGAALYYEDAGEGAPIVFLHGAWAGLRFFEPQLTALSEEYRTIAFDFRGHGRSEKTEQGHTVQQYARDLHVFLDRRDLNDVVLVGWSMGAGVTWEYVDQFGTDRVRALVTVDSEPSPLQREDYDFGTTDLKRLSNTIVGVQTDHLDLVEQHIESLLKDAPSRELKTMMFDELSRTPPPIKSTIFADILRAPPDALSELDVPMLVCAGADEKWRNVESVKHVADTVSNARFELFEESGHCITVEEPKRFNQVVQEFLNSI